MPLAKIHVVEGRYDQARIAKVSGAVQAALMNTLRVPPEDFYQLIFELPKNRFRHTPSFVGMQYTDDLIILDVTFIQGRPKETRLALLKDINTRIATAAGVSPDDMLIWARRGVARQCRRARVSTSCGDNHERSRGQTDRACIPPQGVADARQLPSGGSDDAGAAAGRRLAARTLPVA